MKNLIIKYVFIYLMNLILFYKKKKRLDFLFFFGFCLFFYIGYFMFCYNIIFKQIYKFTQVYILAAKVNYLAYFREILFD